MACGGACGCQECQTPIHPKRHNIVRHWGLEPQDHAIHTGEYHHTMSPQQFGQLRATEKFNKTPLEG